MSDNMSLKHQWSPDEIQTALIYGLIVVLGGGSAGIYIPLLMGKDLSADSLSTYIFAILAPCCADAFLHEPYWKKLSKFVRMVIGLGLTLAALLALSALIRSGKSWDLTSGVLGTLFVLVVWFLLALYSGRFTPDEVISTTGPLGSADITPAHLEGGGLQ